MKERKCSQGFPCGKSCISKARKCWANLSDDKQKVSESFSQYVKRTTIEEKPSKLLEDNRDILEWVNNNALEQTIPKGLKDSEKVALHQFSAGYYDRVNSKPYDDLDEMDNIPEIEEKVDSLLKGDKLPRYTPEGMREQASHYPYDNLNSVIDEEGYLNMAEGLRTDQSNSDLIEYYRNNVGNTSNKDGYKVATALKEKSMDKDKITSIKYKIKPKPNSEGRMVDGVRHEYGYNAHVAFHPDVKFKISNTEEREDGE